MVTVLCQRYKAKVAIVAESAKERPATDLSTEVDGRPVSYEQEEGLDFATRGDIRHLRNKGVSIQVANVGYDLVPAHRLISYIKEN